MAMDAMENVGNGVYGYVDFYQKDAVANGIIIPISIY